ncbi:MAG: saccharopine dehydrogenase NADP-binding domain-containing protein [Hyphomonadaceae bacterium]|nr:saccharopine dehydrogenase NADP-binding domain-containing protein [Hyphomonadaceae bacterium]
MRVVALGGAGAMGRRAIRFISDNPKVESIVVADLNEDAAKAFAAEVGFKASARKVDIGDIPAMDRLLGGADVVLNFVGPYYKHGATVLQAAIRNRIHYMDINDDWEPTLDMLEFDDQARAAGIIAVIGMGASPGLSNLLASAAVRQLDRVDTLHICMNMDAADVDDSDVPDPHLDASYINAAAVHSMQQMASDVRIRRDGKFVDTPAWAKVEFKDMGVAVSSGRILGHPEPLTLPRTFPTIQNSAALMLANESDAALADELVAKVRSGEMSREDGARVLVQAVGERPPTVLSPAGDAERGLAPVVMAYAAGEKDGKTRHVALRVSSLPGPGMAKLTSIPLGVALGLLIDGKITRRGVCSAEGAIDPDDFFAALAPHTYPPRKNRDDLIVCTII